MYPSFCSTTFCHFSGNFIILCSQNFSFWAKNYSRCLLQSCRKLNFFTLTEFYKDKNKWKSEGAMSDEQGGWIELPSQAVTVFALSSKKHAILPYPDGANKGLLSNPTTNTTSPLLGWRPVFDVVGGGSFHLPHDLFCSTLLCWLFSINVLIWSLSTSIGLPNHGASSSEKPPARTFAYDLTHSISHSTFSTYCTNLFLHFSYFFTFLEIIKRNMPKCCLSSFVFNTKMTTQKSNFGSFFFKCTLIWQPSQYDLTKLFQMKKKRTTKRD